MSRHESPTTNWQTMNTAPRDGTEFLGVWKTGVMCVISLENDWMSSEDNGEPMFWTPLPDAPKEVL